jgi:Flp pilus assembly protein TadB
MTPSSSRTTATSEVPRQDAPPSAGAAMAWSWQPRDPGEEQAREAHAARRQGMISGAVGLTVAALFYLWLHRPVFAEVVAGIAALTTLAALASPRGLYRRLTRVLDVFAHAVGMVVTWVLMFILYALLFVPFGLFLRLTGKIALRARADSGTPTYWTTLPAAPVDPESYRKQF